MFIIDTKFGKFHWYTGIFKELLQSINSCKRESIIIISIEAEYIFRKSYKSEESLEALQAGISHLQKKIRYYTLVNDAVKNKKVLPKWEEV